MLPTIWQNDAFRTFLREAGYTKLQWNDGLKEYLVYILSASPYLTLNDLLKLYYDTYGTWEIQFTPDDLFILGQNGLWWDATSTNYMTQLSNGTIPVVNPTDPVGLMIDRSGNSNDGIQATTSLKPLYQTSPSRIVFDGVNDFLSITFPNNFIGDFVLGNLAGVFRLKVSYQGSVSIKLPSSSVYTTSILMSPMLGLIIRDIEFSYSELQYLKHYFISVGAPAVNEFTGDSLYFGFSSTIGITEIFADDWDTAGITSLRSSFSYLTGLTKIHGISEFDTSQVTNMRQTFGNTKIATLELNDWNTSSCTTMLGFVTNNSNLTTLVCSNWDVSNVLDMSEFARFCTGLTELDISGWSINTCTTMAAFVDGCTNLHSIIIGEAFSNSICTNYNQAFRNCALDQTSVDSILVSINTAGTNNGTLGIESGTNATPSIIGQVATDALRGRGWTVTLNGY